MSRAEGSFGVQVHSTLEPGVVVIASKNQPMSISFDTSKPIVLYGSEAEAVAVPIDKGGNWLPNRIDLDSHGEIMRIGKPRQLIEGFFREATAEKKKQISTNSDAKNLLELERNSFKSDRNSLNMYAYTSTSTFEILTLDSGIEIRSYSLIKNAEATASNLLKRSIHIYQSPMIVDPSVDLIAKDLAVTPSVLATVDRGTNSSIIFFIFMYLLVV
jgi:hypothetical protein